MDLTHFAAAICAIAGFLVAVKQIYDFIARPVKYTKKKTEQEIQKMINAELDKRYEQSQEDFKSMIAEEINPRLEELTNRVNYLNQRVEAITDILFNLLQEKLLDIYLEAVEKQKIRRVKLKLFDELFKRYKELNGDGVFDLMNEQLHTFEIDDDFEDKKI